MSYKNFRMTDRADQAIQNKDRTAIVNLLSSICYRDKSFSTGEFDDALEYVTKEKQFQDIWEPFNDTPPLFRPRVESCDSTLTEDDYPKAVIHCNRNFCQERVDDMKLLGRYLFPTTSPTPAASKNNNDTSHKARSVEPKVVLSILAACAAVITVVALIVRAVNHLK